MKKSILIVVVILSAAVAGAFEQTKPPAGRYQLEQSQTQVQGQMGYTGRVEQVGTVPLDTSQEKQATSIRGNQDAATTMRLAQERAAAKTSITSASKRDSAAKSGKSAAWTSGLLFLVLGFAAIVGAMRWADKKLPPAPKARKAK